MIYRTSRSGLSLIETVIGVALFALVSTMLYSTYSRVLTVARLAKARVDAISIADEQFELARNMAYGNLGTQGGVPPGTLPQSKIVSRGGNIFAATTTIRNIDLSFDGTAGGSPNDLSPADNKLVEIDIDCITCKKFRPLVLTTWVGPLSLEGSSTNGSLFVKAIDAAGLPVAKADVHVWDASTTPSIDVYDVTSTSGVLELIDVPPANQGYQIKVSKSGYSSEATYGVPTTTNPVKPHATVATQAVTQLTFAIDKVADLNFSAVTPLCTPIPNVNLHISGAKLIATSPDIHKYDRWLSTDGSGLLDLNDMEWDTYSITATSGSYELAGVVPLLPVPVAPGANQNVQLIMVPKSDPSVLITVKDQTTGLPLSGADVTLQKVTAVTKTTGRGFLSQTDWSGGTGQADYVDQSRYFANDGNIDALTTPGQVELPNNLGNYPPSGWLESSTFDTGASSNFYQFTYKPTSQPPATGDSVRFQIATGNSTSSWTYLGPDGTAGTFYNSTTTDISNVNDGHRYLRYKMYLSTASSTLTPTVSDIGFTFTSACVPPGQVIFQGLTTGTYNITVSKPGYTDVVDTVTINPGDIWREKEEDIGP